MRQSEYLCYGRPVKLQGFGFQKYFNEDKNIRFLHSSHFPGQIDHGKKRSTTTIRQQQKMDGEVHGLC